ncbi:endosome-associated-trafficking regulator 1 [Osmerus eperlanus]|uniref:endosome-associated-trafficking regulator 1 n=1 Tax=Osmerus eperlanus TaxID=29151 RepID=UPI002E0EBFB1
MSKPKTSAKTLIIEDDEVQEDGDELNPFSFKEFIRSKNKDPDMNTDSDETFYPMRKKTYGSSLLSDREYPSYSNLDGTPQPGEESEEDWAGSYEPSALEDAQEFVLSRTADCSTYSDPSSLGTEEEVSWQEEQGEEPSLLEESLWQGSRQGPVNYEGDDETSMVELSFRTQTGRPEGKRNHLQKLQDENAQLRKNVRSLLKKAEIDDRRLRELTEELHKKRLQDEREAQALETMVHSVEQNLHLMTKRAVKAENSVTRLKQELHQLQGQMEGYQCENERLRAGETTALNTMRQNAQAASEYLNKAALNAETSIKQLLTGAETLCLVSQLLHSIDKISDLQAEN